MQIVWNLDDNIYYKLKKFNKNIEEEIKNLLKTYIQKKERKEGKFDKFVGILDKNFKTDDIKYNEIVKWKF